MITSLAALMDHEFDYVDIPASIAPVDSSSTPLAGENLFVLNQSNLAAGRLHHHVSTAEKARAELGYTEKVDPLHWMAKTVEHQLAHPPATDGSHPSLSPLDFNYAAEDELLAWWDTTVAHAPSAGPAVTRGHAYEHPKTQP